MLKPLGEAVGNRISPQITLKKGEKGTFKVDVSQKLPRERINVNIASKRMSGERGAIT